MYKNVLKSKFKKKYALQYDTVSSYGPAFIEQEKYV